MVSALSQVKSAVSEISDEYIKEMWDQRASWLHEEVITLAAERLYIQVTEGALFHGQYLSFLSRKGITSKLYLFCVRASHDTPRIDETPGDRGACPVAQNPSYLNPCMSSQILYVSFRLCHCVLTYITTCNPFQSLIFWTCLEQAGYQVIPEAEKSRPSAGRKSYILGQPCAAVVGGCHDRSACAISEV